MRHMVRIINGDHVVDREATDEENERIEAGIRENALKIEQHLAMLSAKASARAKLKALGLTDDEIAAMVG